MKMNCCLQYDLKTGYGFTCDSVQASCLGNPSNLAQNTASPCLSDMERRLNRLMNSQVALQGLNYTPTPPSHTYQTHIHLHTH